MTKKKNPRYVRPEDALPILHEALKARSNSEQRQALLDWALMAYAFGLVNQRRFKARGDRRGRPKGRCGVRYDDQEAIKLMHGIAVKFGERKPHKLATLVVQQKLVPLNGSQELSVIRRLASRYRDMQK